MKDKKTMQAPQIEFFSFGASDMIVTSGGEEYPLVSDPMKAADKDDATGYKTFGGFSGVPGNK